MRARGTSSLCQKLPPSARAEHQPPTGHVPNAVEDRALQTSWPVPCFRRSRLPPQQPSIRGTFSCFQLQVLLLPPPATMGNEQDVTILQRIVRSLRLHDLLNVYRNLGVAIFAFSNDLDIVQ